MNKLKISPTSIQQYGFDTKKHFYVLAPHIVLQRLEITEYELGPVIQTFACNDIDSVYQVFNHELHDDAHILLILPYSKESLSLSQMTDRLIKPSQKVLMMKCIPSHGDLAVLEYFLKVLQKTDVAAQEQVADDFYDLLEKAHGLVFQNSIVDECATLQFDDFCLWNDLFGYVQDGDIMVAPSGEIALSHEAHASVDLREARLDINGMLCLTGYSIVHQMSSIVDKTQQSKLFQQLSTLRNVPVLAEIKSGEIVNLTSKNSIALTALQELLQQDARYRVISEIGFGLNTQMQIMEEINTGMNEIYGHQKMCVHFGFGNIHTDYHFDILCPDMHVCTIDENKQVISEWL